MIVDALRSSKKELHGGRVVLFGSRAAGTARDRSDFDIGELANKPIPLADFMTIEDRLESLPTLFRIDLVDLKRTSERFREQALSQTEVLLG